MVYYIPTEQKRILRKAEKYNKLKNLHRKTISTAKASHITHKFDKLANDSKSIHRLSAQLLGRSLKAPLPTVTPKNYNSSSIHLSTTNFPPPFPPFPHLSCPPLPSYFPSPLKNVNLPHLIKSSPFSNLPPQPHLLILFPSQY